MLLYYTKINDRISSEKSGYFWTFYIFNQSTNNQRNGVIVTRGVSINFLNFYLFVIFTNFRGGL